MSSPLDFGFLSQQTGAGGTYAQWVMSAWGWTLAVSALSFALALVVGVLAGAARTSGNSRLQLLGDAWTELFRNIPILVQIFLWYYVLPEFVPILKSLPSFVLVVIALGLFTSARVSEQFRAGINSLGRGQRAAALAMGLTLPQAYRYVLLPNALRIVIPPLTSEAMSVIKNSSVAFAVSIAELTMFAIQAQEETARGVEVYLVVTLLYFVSAYTVGRGARMIEKALAIPGTIGGAK